MGDKGVDTVCQTTQRNAARPLTRSRKSRNNGRRREVQPRKRQRLGQVHLSLFIRDPTRTDLDNDRSRELLHRKGF